MNFIRLKISTLGNNLDEKTGEVNRVIEVIRVKYFWLECLKPRNKSIKYFTRLPQNVR